MSKTQAFKAFALIMRCLFWIMAHMENRIFENYGSIADDHYEFMQENFKDNKS